jgi:hypothetical protein
VHAVKGTARRSKGRRDGTMKRAFLFGLGSFLILVIIGLLVRHDTPNVYMPRQ